MFQLVSNRKHTFLFKKGKAKNDRYFSKKNSKYFSIIRNTSYFHKIFTSLNIQKYHTILKKIYSSSKTQKRETLKIFNRACTTMKMEN